jgi:methyl-accepting chemotaxis protein
MRGTIAQRIVVGFALIVGLVTVLGTFAFVRLMAIEGETTTITSVSLPGLHLSGQIESEARGRFQAVLKHVIAADAAAMTQLEADIRQADARLDQLLSDYEKRITDEADRRNFDRVKPADARIRAIRDNDVMPLSRALKTAEAEQVVHTQLEPAIAEFVRAVHALVTFNKAEGDAASRNIRADVSRTKAGILIALLAAVTLSIVIAFLIVRSTSRVLASSVREITAGAEQVSSAASQVSQSSQSLANDANSQAAALEETSASMEQMAATTRQSAENSRRGADLMGEMANRVQESSMSLGAMVDSMRQIQESSAKVSKIIKTVDEIAFQTNILALNAAVEAARAGDAGKGFAVVADEVRTLAQRSAQAAKDTAVLIEEALRSAEAGGQRVQQVDAAFSGIVGHIDEAKRIVEDVSAACQQQMQGISQVTTAITEIGNVTQRTAATSEESAAASEELTSQADSALQVATGLQQLVGGQARAA